MNHDTKTDINITQIYLKGIEDHVEGFRQVRKEHRNELVDDYVELIFDLICELGEARQVDIAARLGVSQPTVAKMLKRLSIIGLIQQMPYRGIFLTTKGKKIAAASRVRHRIVEKFLMSIGVSKVTARRDSEGLEHHVSAETLKVFQKFYEKR